jgi:hypothetical protein
MSFIQSIRALPLNRHGFIDVLVGINLIQAIHITLIAVLCNLDAGPDDEETKSLVSIAVFMMLVAPLIENFIMIVAAAIHEKLFNRRLLFVVAPLFMALLHFTTPHDLPVPIFIRLIALFFFFYFFLKQYDLHKLEMGKGKAYLLSCIIHSSVNATVILVLSAFDFYIAAETIFSAQPGE